MEQNLKIPGENSIDSPISTFKFQRMSWMLSLRGLFLSPEEVLDEVDIRPGFRVLDYGCGTGSFTFEAAQRVGPEGKVYALDIHPLALEKVLRKAQKKGLANIETVLTSCITQVAFDSVDAVLFYYVLHWLNDPDCVLKELYRVLKNNGILSFRDPYMKEEEILVTVTGKGWFGLSEKGDKTYRFARIAREVATTPSRM
jgi:ubiquinone/menaquinone biosynthesis C-methylase UbiE